MLTATTLTQTAEKKLLGVQIDENLSFKNHIKLTAAKATRALAKTGAFVRENKGASAEVMTLLYKACVRPLLEYAYPVWCTVDDITPLRKIQSMALRGVAGAMGGTSTDAIEVVTCTLPIDIRLQENLLKEFAKINSRPNDNENPLRKTIYRLVNDPAFNDHRVKTPIHIYKMAARNFNLPSLQCNLEKHTDETINDILGPRISSDLIAWSNLGNSGTRTQLQKHRAKQIASNYINTLGKRIIAFTAALP